VLTALFRFPTTTTRNIGSLSAKDRYLIAHSRTHMLANPLTLSFTHLLTLTQQICYPGIEHPFGKFTGVGCLNLSAFWWSLILFHPSLAVSQTTALSSFVPGETPLSSFASTCLSSALAFYWKCNGTQPLSTFSKHYFNFFSRIPQFFFSLKTHSKSVGSVFSCGRITGIAQGQQYMCWIVHAWWSKKGIRSFC